MGFVLGSRLLALITLAAAPAWNAAAARLTLASGASRTCTGETRVGLLRQGGQPVGDDLAQSVAMSETLSVRLTGDRYEIRRSNSMPGGETHLVAHIRPDGTVIDANMSGSLPMMRDGERLQESSMLAARMLSERLVMGRDFRPGDNLYANVDMRDLVAGIMGTMAAPPGFQFQVDGALPFTGVTGVGANRSFNFAGQMRATGEGEASAGRLNMTFPARTTIVMDAATGLMRSMAVEGIMEVRLNGVTQTEMQMRQTMTCTISPAA